MESVSFDPNGIVAGDHPLTHKSITVLSGEGVLPRGTVMGQATIGAATSAAKSGGNTGNGTLTMDATTPVRAGAKVGVYQVRCIQAVTNNGIFQVTDPDGFSLGQFALAAGAATFSDDIKFAMADGATDFAVGDGFDITVAAGSGKWKKSTTAAIDGSAVPRSILGEDVDATSSDITAPAFFEGEFAQEKLTYGSGHSATTVEAAFRANNAGLYLRSIGAAA